MIDDVGGAETTKLERAGDEADPGPKSPKSCPLLYLRSKSRSPPCVFCAGTASFFSTSGPS